MKIQYFCKINFKNYMNETVKFEVISILGGTTFQLFPFFVNCVMSEFCFRFDYTFQNRTYHGFHQALILICFSCGTALCGSTKPVFYERIGILILSTFLCVLWYFLIPKSKYRKFQPQCPKCL